MTKSEHTHTHTHTHTNTHIHKHAHTHSLTLTHTHTHTHKLYPFTTDRTRGVCYRKCQGDTRVSVCAGVLRGTRCQCVLVFVVYTMSVFCSRCSCYSCLTSSLLSTAQCKFECQNGGRCVGLNKCKCRAGFTGTQCQIRQYTDN